MDWGVPMTASFEVTFKFDGRLADQGILDGSDHEAAVAGSRRLLALHAHAFIHGFVPRAAQSEGEGYHVVHVASHKGSHNDLWQVIINNAWTVQIVGGVLAGAYANEVKAVINASARFLGDSVRAAIGTGPDHLPELRRKEPILEASNGNRQPIIDVESEQRHERVRLRQLTSRVLLDVARPVGRSAGSLAIIVERETIAFIDEDAKRRWLDDQITTAVRNMRQPVLGIDHR